MASKFIIFLVLAAAARSSATVKQSELEGKLSTIKNLGVKTRLDLQALVHGVFDGIDKKLNNALPCQLEDTKKKCVAKFREAYDDTMTAVKSIANNPDEIETDSCEFRAKLDEAVSLLWGPFDMTLSENPDEDIDKVAEMTEETAQLAKDIWNALYEKITKAVGIEDDSITAAIKEVQLLAMDNVDCAVRAMMTAMKFYVLAASAESCEDFTRYINAIKVQYDVALLTKWAEVNEKISFLQHVAVYNFDGSIDNIKDFTEIAAAAKVMIFRHRDIFNTAAATRDEAEVSTEYFDDLEKYWYDLFKEAFAAVEGSMKLIPSDVTITIDEDAVIKAFKDVATGIRNGAEVTHGKDAWEVEDKIEEIKEGIIENASFAWKKAYVALEETSKDVEGSEAVIENAWKKVDVDIKKVIDTLFDALTGKLPEGYTMSDLEYIIIEEDIIRLFDLIRCLRLIVYLRQSGIEVALESVYDDQLAGKPTSAY